MRIPTVLWAQRKDKLYLTLDIQDVKDQKLKLENDESGKTGKLIFSGKAGADEQEYALELPFYGEIDTEGSKVSVSPRHIFCVVRLRGSARRLNLVDE
jgi:cytosolic prostaglandin-E synthase